MVDTINQKEIDAAIAKVAQKTIGNIHVEIRDKCEVDVQHQAEQLFIAKGMDKLPGRNGVLILVGMQSKRFAIIGDLGIHEKIGDDFWVKARDTMQSHFRVGEFTQGVLKAIASLGDELDTYFPRSN